MQQKIKSVRFYQAVYINNTPETYVRAPEYADANRRDGKDKSKLSLHERGVLIENENELILVGWPNIGSLQFEKPVLVEEPAAQERQSGNPAKPGKKVTDFRDV
jgi:hypothetical protein